MEKRWFQTKWVTTEDKNGKKISVQVIASELPTGVSINFTEDDFNCSDKEKLLKIKKNKAKQTVLDFIEKTFEEDVELSFPESN